MTLSTPKFYEAKYVLNRQPVRNEHLSKLLEFHFSPRDIWGTDDKFATSSFHLFLFFLRFGKPESSPVIGIVLVSLYLSSSSSSSVFLNAFQDVLRQDRSVTARYDRTSSVSHLKYTFCCSLPKNILSLTPTSNPLTRKYIHFIQSTFISVDTQAFASKGIL